MKEFLPPGFMEHRKKARKEMLLAWRSLIDAALNEWMKKRKKKLLIMTSALHGAGLYMSIVSQMALLPRMWLEQKSYHRQGECPRGKKSHPQKRQCRESPEDITPGDVSTPERFTPANRNDANIMLPSQDGSQRPSR